MLRIFAIIAPSTAASTSASSKTRNGALPPSSMLTRWSWSADCFTSTLPTPVDPVKLSLRSRGSAMIAELTSPELWVVTTLSTPSGSPASANVAASASIVSGVCCAGLTTIVQPAATAGPIFRVPMASGKFHGVTKRHGPTGFLMVSRRLATAGAGMPPPWERHAAPGGLPPAPVDADRLLGEPAEELVAVGDLAGGLLDGLAHLETHQLGEL